MSEKDTKSKKSRKSKMSKNKKIAITVVSVLAVIVAILVGTYFKIRNQIYVEYKPTPTEGVNYKEVDGITNVLLIGTDGRTLDEVSRSDSIIIATLDNNNKKVKLTSVMRDTLVDVPGYGEQKINAAFALGSANGGGAEGGAKLLMETLSDTFEINLDKYVVVNFWGFEAIIDEIGGIEVEVKDYEIEELNKYIGEATGLNSPLIEVPGLQKLNGQQALSYSRIRKVGNGSYERTERQRRVLYEVATKLKEVNPLKYMSIANSLSKHVKTNIDIPQALNLAYTIYKFPSLDFEQLQMPQTELVVRDGLYKDLGWVLLIDKKQNSKVLNEFIFDNKLPNPDEFDYNQIAYLQDMYASEEAGYNSMYGINPDDYNDKDVDYEEDIYTPTPDNGNGNGNNNGNTNGDSNGGNQITPPPVVEPTPPVEPEKPPTPPVEPEKPPVEPENPTPPPTEGGDTGTGQDGENGVQQRNRLLELFNIAS
ncbi:LCP family protein [Clostridium sp.]|uniref:LCP family protein n=1 Tax=Clostridium sp. TaxID=1506 RepID=UPI003F2F157A